MMSHLDIVESWLQNLSEDLRVFIEIMSDERFSVPTRQCAVGAINYLFKSVDLIPDGIDDIGYLDDAISLRFAAALIDVDELEKTNPAHAGKIEMLRRDLPVIREILGEGIFERFRHYSLSLPEGSARGRNPRQIVECAEALAATKSEAEAFRRSYRMPDFEKSDRTLVKLRSYFDTRLPR